MEPNLPFSPAVIQAFYARVLQFDHWQSSARTPRRDRKADLQGFLNIHALDKEIEVWQHLRHPRHLANRPTETPRRPPRFVLKPNTQHPTKVGDTVKWVRISDNQILVLVLSPAGSLEAKVYSNMHSLGARALRLTAPVTQLYYSSDLELMPHVRQVLEGTLLTTHCFHVDTEGVHGLITRGYTFQKFETFIRARLQDTQDLFFVPQEDRAALH